MFFFEFGCEGCCDYYFLVKVMYAHLVKVMGNSRDMDKHLSIIRDGVTKRARTTK
jgi:hypothetical protein